MAWKPQKTRVNLVIDLVILLLMLSMAWTGLVIRYVLPPGSGRGDHGLSVWGMSRHDWGGLHFWLSLALLTLLLLHLVLHWGWICGVVRNLFQRQSTPPRQRAWLGLAALAGCGLLVGGLTWLVSSAVHEQAHVSASAAQRSREPSGPSDGPSDGQPGARSTGPARMPAQGTGWRAQAAGSEQSPIRGYMSLAQVASRQGLSPDRLKRMLGLPPEAPADERIGWLCREYGLQWSSVRRTLARQPAGRGRGRGQGGGS